MSGVIDEHGQWEHCMVCLDFVLIQDLLYEEPSTEHSCGRDICPACICLPEDVQDEITDKAVKVAVERSMKRYEEMGWTVRLNPDNSISILEIP